MTIRQRWTNTWRILSLWLLLFSKEVYNCCMLKEVVLLRHLMFLSISAELHSPSSTRCTAEVDPLQIEPEITTLPQYINWLESNVGIAFRYFFQHGREDFHVFCLSFAWFFWKKKLMIREVFKTTDNQNTFPCVKTRLQFPRRASSNGIWTYFLLPSKISNTGNTACPCLPSKSSMDKRHSIE